MHVLLILVIHSCCAGGWRYRNACLMASKLCKQNSTLGCDNRRKSRKLSLILRLSNRKNTCELEVAYSWNIYVWLGSTTLILVQPKMYNMELRKKPNCSYFYSSIMRSISRAPGLITRSRRSVCSYWTYAKQLQPYAASSRLNLLSIIYWELVHLQIYDSHGAVHVV